MRPYRVLDLSRLLPGPFATLCLQGLGFEVVKVETPDGGDYLRNMPPEHDGVGVWFAALNRGKKSVTLDLKAEGGREGLRRLLAEADVLVESFRPGVLARLRLDPADLRRSYPRLVIASLTGWGQHGPLAHTAGHDLGFMALAGLIRPESGVPTLQWADLAGGGLHAALRIVAALLDRERSGEGTWLDIAMLDGLIGMQCVRVASLRAGYPDADAVLTGGAAIYQLYRCADGRSVSVGALEPQFFGPLGAEAGGLDEATLADFFSRQPAAAWGEQLGHLCVVPVLELDEALRHPQVASRGLFSPEGYAHPPTGPVIGPPPRLGQHNQELLGA